MLTLTRFMNGLSSMRLTTVLACLLLSIALSGCESLFERPVSRAAPAPVRTVVPQEYRLSTGDVISVRVKGGD